jgi:hypothetical protein
MGHDDRREIFERLEALERRIGSGRRERDGDGWRGRDRNQDRDRDRDRDRGRRDRGDEEFQEKRVIDTIVRLVSEEMTRILDRQQQERSADRDEGGNEKRTVDLIVRLVSEHVQEIVSVELDRRLGRPDRRPEDNGDDAAARRRREVDRPDRKRTECGPPSDRPDDVRVEPTTPHASS